MSITKWFHHLLNPHCRECYEERTESKVCESCETLKVQLSIANAEKRQLLDSILEKPTPQIEIEHTRKPIQIPEDLKARQMTWNVYRQMLEAEDREKAKILRKQAEDKRVAELEKELGVSHDETVRGSTEADVRSQEHEEQAEKEG